MPLTATFAYARHALVAALRHLGARPGDVVALPEFICRDVLASLHHVGVRPHYYPIGRDLRPLDSSIDKTTRFVLMVNYFGFPQNVSEFRMKWPNAQIIEDNAHGYLGRDEFGIDLGSRTEAGITSCRKTIMLPDGALLRIASDGDQLISDTIDARTPPLSFRIRSLSSRLERASDIPINFALRTMLRAIRKGWTGSSLPRSDDRSETELPKDVYMSRLASKILGNVDRDREVERRRRLFREFLSFASDHNVRSVFNELPAGCAPYGFPFFAESSIPSLEQFARRQHCEVIRWPDLPRAVSVSADHYYRLVHVVNFL